MGGWVVGYTFLRVEYMGYTEYTVYTVYPVTFDVFNRFAPPYPPTVTSRKSFVKLFFISVKFF